MNVSLVLLKKDGRKKVFPVRNKAVILGRRPDCDLCVPLQVVSRRHCQLSLEPQALKVRDLHSSNGTYLNGRKVLDELPVNPGDDLQIGPLTFKVQIDGKPDNFALPNNNGYLASPDISKADSDAMNRSGTFVS